jgi:DNA invertase Pin-like site-specific DNA recombinase
MAKKYVAYYRVSTEKQGRSGLGLNAQRAIVRHYTKEDKAELVSEMTEQASGKEIDNRPILQNALVYCVKNDCTLIVAKLDRLSRDVEHVFKIKKVLGENLICCDLPTTDSLVLSIFAGLAQRERELISIRTKAALKVKKEKGATLGTLKNLTIKGRKKGAQAMKDKANKNMNNVRATLLIVSLRDSGKTLQAICDELNKNGFQTARNKQFKPTTVKLLYERAKQS